MRGRAKLGSVVVRRLESLARWDRTTKARVGHCPSADLDAQATIGFVLGPKVLVGPVKTAPPRTAGVAVICRHVCQFDRCVVGAGVLLLGLPLLALV